MIFEHCVLIVSIILLILGGASVFAPYGGWDRDYRYFLAAVPLFAPFLGAVLDFLLDNASDRRIIYVRYSILAVFVLLCAASFRFQFAHIRHEGQIQYSNLFVNYEAALVNISLFLTFAIGIALLIIAITRTVRYFYPK